MLLERLRRPGPYRHAVLAFARHTGVLPGGPAPPPDLYDALRGTGATIHLLDLADPRQALAAWARGTLDRALARIAAADPPAVIHSTLFHSHLLGARLARRTGAPHVAGKEGTDDWMGGAQRFLEARALRSATRVVAVSEAAARAARQHAARPDRIRVIPNGIDLDETAPWTPPPPPTPAGAERGAPARLLGVGRCDPAKGWEDLLRALVEIRRAEPRAGCDLLASGPEPARQRLRWKAERLGVGPALRLLPTAGEAEPLAREPGAGPSGPSSGPILVVPSREEGFGLVLLEGMALGLPIVATRAGGIPEVARDGVEALLCPPRAPAALAATILRLLRDPALAARLAANGRRRVHDFPADRMAAAYHGLYAEVVGA